MENITQLLQPYISLAEFIQILVSCISLALLWVHYINLKNLFS